MFFPINKRPGIRAIANELHVMLTRYIRAQLVLCCFSFVFYSGALMAGLLGLWRVFQDYFALPRVMGHELKIHPLAAILAVLVGAELGGIVGIYLAVPVVASMRVIWGGRAEKVTEERCRPSGEAQRTSPVTETATI